MDEDVEMKVEPPPDLLRKQVADVALEVDPAHKALTGRTPERIEQETGIDRHQMFPDHGRILYIGDPW